MIYLTTGANGAGKTLFTLYDVRAQQLAENRPVYFSGFEALGKLLDEFGWKPFDPKKWQDLPDASICVMDECQNEFPVRRPGSPVPDYVNAVAQFRRKRGFDFWMITPHPRLLDIFIRSLVESPSWHRHFKRTFGADMASEHRFNAVDLACEKPGSGDKAQVTMRAYPKEVYGWYKSASLHTGKRKLPKAVYVMAIAVVAVPALFWYVFGTMLAKAKPQDIAGKRPAASAPGQPVVPVSAPPAARAPAAPATGPSVSDYVAMHRERIDGLPFTAPRYDAVTTPIEAPYPAACVQMGARCDCFTQQATRLQTPADICRQIAAQGFFIPWARPVHAPAPVQAAVAAPMAPPAPVAMQSEPLASSIAPSSEPAPPGRGRALPRLTGGVAAPSSVHDGQALASMRSGLRRY